MQITNFDAKYLFFSGRLWFGSSDYEKLTHLRRVVVLSCRNQITFTCLKSTIETLEKAEKYVQS